MHTCSIRQNKPVSCVVPQLANVPVHLFALGMGVLIETAGAPLATNIAEHASIWQKYCSPKYHTNLPDLMSTSLGRAVAEDCMASEPIRKYKDFCHEKLRGNI